MKKIRVLIFPCGAENALEIYYAIKDNVNIEVFGASGKSDHASYIYDADHYFEDDYYINNSNFKEKFNNLLIENRIDVLIPTHDTISEFFAKNKDDYKVKILTSDDNTAHICREKALTYDLFSDCSFCPKIFKDIKSLKAMDFPIFSKPNIGEGAKGTKLIHNINELSVNYDKDTIYLEYLPGDEYTIDCYTDKKGDLRFIGMRTRERINMGIAFRSRCIPLDEKVKEIANVINTRLSLFGGWFFQVKKDSKGMYKLLEVSCRMAGTMTLHRHKGINFSMLGILELMGFDINIIDNQFHMSLDRALDAQYNIDYEFDKVYIDYDDTITKDSGTKVNDNVMRFLYQCFNSEKKIILLTRHEGDLDTELEEKCISKRLFSSIKHFSFDEDKISFINPDRAIFIDNSFAERLAVYKEYNIPVFDVDAIDTLIKK